MISYLEDSALRSTITLILAVSFTPSIAESEGLDFFENEVRPILSKHCYECHSQDADPLEGGLRLDRRSGWLQGGNSGATLVPGEPGASLLIRAIRYDHPRLNMPPDEKLSDRDIKRIVSWVAMGAPAPPDNGAPPEAAPPMDIEKGRQFWAFQRPRRPPPAAGTGGEWPRNKIDTYIRAEHQLRGLTPVGDADPLSFLRRICFDLTGLPPDPQMIRAVQQDPSPQTMRRLVDDLISSPQFGERWGRHWLDVARYASSIGLERNFIFRSAWRYRDYVIDSFNADKPYDQFVREQIAGDLLPANSVPERNQKNIATGFLALGLRSLQEPDLQVYRAEEVAEQIDTLGRAFMGLTLGCARCHDHKFAPIPTRDFYALAGILQSTQMLAGFGRLDPDEKAMVRSDLLIPVSTDPTTASEVRQRSMELAQKLEELYSEKLELQRSLREIQDAGAFDKEANDAVSAKLKETNDLWKQWNIEFRNKYPLAMGVREGEKVRDAAIQIGGDPYNPGTVVPRGFLQVLSTGEKLEELAMDNETSGRLQLARWVSRPENPLTARVMVNRIWKHLFGRGLVRTVDNFGPSGESPSHQKVLDYLAVEFMENGWSVKHIVRQIVTSRTYRLSTDHEPGNYAIDPENVYLWRMNSRRLEVEAFRDAVLTVSRNLDTRRPESSLIQTEEERVPQQVQGFDKVLEENYRTVYLPVFRRALPGAFQLFDMAPPTQVTGSRDVTTVPTQALYLMNNAFILDNARRAAKNLVEMEITQAERIRTVFLETVNREPSTKEQHRMAEYFSTSISEGLTEVDAWTDIYRAQFSSAEFFYRN